MLSSVSFASLHHLWNTEHCQCKWWHTNTNRVLLFESLFLGTEEGFFQNWLVLVYKASFLHLFSCLKCFWLLFLFEWVIISWFDLVYFVRCSAGGHPEVKMFHMFWVINTLMEEISCCRCCCYAKHNRFTLSVGTLTAFVEFYSTFTSAATKIR